MKILVASNNAKKLKELERILERAGIHGIELVPLRDVEPYEEPVEDGRTFADNALLKARAGVQATGLPTVADDSGITIEELGGMPGVLSARWSGEHGNDRANNDLVLAQMSHAGEGRRNAAFVSVCALVTPEGHETVSEGRWNGELLTEPRGEGGFGYDPLFKPEGQDCSAAELTPEAKDAVSHRGKALAGLVSAIAALSPQS
ncbi:RdgB/HAM1 family non-canonical purine NTP pyrophosphatase [Corynebacterium tapiri]|uniref:dITP/XTP pyrophosphatase n=1 Tax=Corynebacterium tapiri TaxID=1448266 RepID=A0A5C4U3R5_9CORY|nr:RdgB/HAM1 family non-canonical purine NTP pyrophosphatase [Corynebacterium tapiri]TNL95658.1 RdgB/HAM1 family non-canonical purine NTP pyrophosphatase [Corynebacterium tapiri]